ncbi:MAG: helix-turn-helix domain-containing protein [Gemmatimonadaceae bacterium]
MFIHTVPELAALVRERRKALGLTQADVAARIGASRQWLVAFEGGQTNVELAPVLRALRLLGLTIAVTPIATEPRQKPSADTPRPRHPRPRGAAGPAVQPPSGGASANGVRSVLARLRAPRQPNRSTDR